MKPYIDNQNGVVALLTSIVVGVLLIIITSGAIAVSVGELRQASDYDNSVKAYFAAESGAEDAIATIRRGMTKQSGAYSINTLAKDNCPAYSSPYETSYLDKIDGNGSVSIDGTGALKYTCQIVQVETNEITGTLEPEEVVQIDLTGTNFNQLRLSWNLRGSTDPQGYIKSSVPTTFPTGESWKNIYPAVMETTIISYPAGGGSFSSCQVRSATAVFKPAPATSNRTLNSDFTKTDCSANPSIATPVLTNCDPSNTVGGYDCSMTIGNFNTAASGNRYIIRLNARYSPTNYKLEALSGGVNVAIPNAQLQIDVTGRSGDISRRVLLKAPLSGQSAVPDVLLANDSICKLLTVSRVPGSELASPINGCE